MVAKCISFCHSIIFKAIISFISLINMLFFITFINVILSFFSLLFISLTLNQLYITLETHAMKKQKHTRAKDTSIRFSGLKLRLVINFACRKNFCFEGYIGSIKFEKRNTDNYFFFLLFLLLLCPHFELSNKSFEKQ